MHAPASTQQLALVPRWTIRPEEVESAATSLDPVERDALLWIDSFGRRNNLTLAQVGARLQKERGGCYSKDTVYQALTGRETALAKFVAAVQRFRSTVITSPSEFPFVETSVYMAVASYIDLCRQWHKMGLIIGESQTGKSRTIKEKVRQLRADGASVIYIQLPEGGYKSKLVELMAEAIGVSMNTHARRELMLEKAITPDTTIILDELQQCSSRTQSSGSRSKTERVGTIEFVRRLRDVTGCSVLLVGTTEALHMLQGSGVGHDNGPIFIQTLKRSLDPFVLKNSPPRRDLDAFSRHLGLDPAEGEARALQDRIAVQRGLELWLTYLLAGAQRAAKESRRPFWHDVLAAYETFVPKTQEKP